MWHWVEKHWERSLFMLMGLLLAAASFWFLIRGSSSTAYGAFGMALFCFVLSNLARFKRFKGFGFEAELWEDKQEEAADLIENVRDVVSILTREAMTASAMQGRWGGESSWKERWALYDELAGKHGALGQKVDFSALKRWLDGVFLFDIVQKASRPLYEALTKSLGEARNKINKEFGNPIRDADGYAKRIKSLNGVDRRIENPFKVSQSGNLAKMTLECLETGRRRLQEEFQIDVNYNDTALENLRLASALCDAGPLPITDQLIDLATE